MIGSKDKMKFALFMIMIFCRCSLEEHKEIKFKQMNFRLLELQRNLVSIGEIAIGDTNLYSDFFLMIRPIGYGTGKELILSIRKLKNDTLCLLSYTKVEFDYPNYFTKTGLERAKYHYPYRVNKTTKFISKNVAFNVFKTLETLIAQKYISPFDSSLNVFQKGDIDDGGTTLFYSNIDGIFECPSSTYNNSKIQSLDSFIFHSIDIENLNREVGYATEPQ
jgi:hypothetical protein